MGKLVKIVCASCGNEWVNKMGCGLMHGSLANIAGLFPEEESNKIRQYAAQHVYPVFDFAYRSVCCKQCGSLVSVPFLELEAGRGTYAGVCERCGGKPESTDVIEELEATPCPVCGRISLQTEEIGLWD